MLLTKYSRDPEFTELLKSARPILPYTLRNGLQYRANRLCLPDGPTRLKILHDCHDS
jgi:hypothetical protein